MEIVWSPSALAHWQETVDYVFQEFGLQTAEKLVSLTDLWISNIEQYPNIGAVEPLLSRLQKQYRSVVVNKNNKIVYRVSVDTIFVEDFWDTRREPKVLKDTIEQK